MIDPYNAEEEQYLDLLQDVVSSPDAKTSRTGVDTYSQFGGRMSFDLRGGTIPLLTSKHVNLRPLVRELIWFLSGSTNINDMGAKIWDQWATEDGELGPIYGKQWRAWEDTRLITLHEWMIHPKWRKQGYRSVESFYSERTKTDMVVIQREIDQVANVIHQLTFNPDSRRIILSAWNPSVLPDESLSPQENVALGNQALAACHTLVQFYTRKLTPQERAKVAKTEHHLEIGPDEEGNWDEAVAFMDSVGVKARELSCQLYARSQDLPLGTPFNIASYALLTHMIAHVTGMVAREFIWVGGDCHVYENQAAGVVEQLTRPTTEFPTVTIHQTPGGGLDRLLAITEDDIELKNYHPQDPIKFPIAI